jgi:hypothetical protein
MSAPLVSYTRPVVVKSPMFVPNVGWVENTILSSVRTGYKQKPPFNLDTVYDYVEDRQLAGWSVALAGNGQTKENEVAATNLARARFVGEIGDSSSFGATLTAELRATWGTVAGGITDALRAAKAVSKGRLGEAAKILKFYPPEKSYPKKRRKLKDGTIRISPKHTVWRMPDGREVAKGLANRWLWYSYGIKPLVGDIYNGMDVLTRPLPYHRIKKSGFVGTSRAGVDTLRSEKLSQKSSVCISAHVRVANPNLWLANQMGLINPLQWINEAIPFSFVIDWFSNLSQVINSMTDFVGLEIARPITTSKHVGLRTLTYPEYQYLKCSSQKTVFNRSLTVPSAKLRFAYERFQWQRGANAISLLVGLLKKGSR